MVDNNDAGFHSGSEETEEESEQSIYCIRIIIEGRVQNVGFRIWLKKKSTQNSVNGWVRNRSNNSVEALLVGKKTDVRDLLKLCYQGPSFAFVKKVKEFPQKDIPNISPGFLQLPSV